MEDAANCNILPTLRYALVRRKAKEIAVDEEEQ